MVKEFSFKGISLLEVPLVNQVSIDEF